MMLLLPHDARVELDTASPGESTPFGKLWESAQRQVSSTGSEAEASIGCGSGLKLADQGGTCKAGSIYCWMTCMSVKGLETCKGGQWTRSALGDVAAFTNLTVGCRNEKSGAVWTKGTCPGCKPACTLDAARAPSPTPVGPQVTYCHDLAEGGLAMYMTGFRLTSDNPDIACLGLFFRSWVIDSNWKLVLACFFVASLGIAMEMLSFLRRQLSPAKAQSTGFFFHGANLMLAYLVMLVIMTYSVELFFCTILGLLIGNIMHVTLGRRAAKRAGGADAIFVADDGPGSPCCRVGHLDPMAVQETALSRVGLLAKSSSVAAGHTANLTLEGMTCGSCVATITKALQAVDGVVSAEVSLERKMAVVRYNPPADPVQLCDAVECVGFDASHVPDVRVEMVVS